MFGLPPPDTAERAAFMAQFWPGLWSGIISSIVTGVIVGLILLYWQRSVEDRAARRTYARDVSLLRERLREAVAIPDVFSIGSARNSVPPQAEAAIKLLRDAPISMWQQELAEDKAFLDAAHTFQGAYSGFSISAAQYDNRLSQFARAFNGARGTIAVNDGMVTAYVLGCLHGFTPAQLAPWLDLGGRQIPQWLDEALTAAQADINLRDSHNVYAASRSALSEALARLIGSIDA